VGIDISQTIDAFVESGTGIVQIATHYYFPFSIYFGNLLSPFIVFLAIIWVSSKMAQRSEIVAILSAGVSFNRFLWPFVLVSMCMTVLILVASHFIVPISNRLKYDFEREYLKSSHRYGLNIHRELEEDKLFYFRNIDEGRKVGYDFSIEDWDDGRMTQKLLAAKAKFDTTSGNWTLSKVTIRELNEDGSEKLRYINSLDTAMALSFGDFGAPSSIVFNMKTPELNKYIEKEAAIGSSRVASLEIEKFFRTSNAFSIIVLGFIAVVLSARKTRGGLGLHLFLAIIIGIVFIFFSRMSSVAATNVGLPAYLAVWIPNILYSGLGIWIYTRAPK
jgi:lipopolysaccharide export system permease protein